MKLDKIVVCGGGVLGTQIAFQSAYNGKDTTIWLRSEGSIGRTQPKLDQVRDSYLADLKQMKESGKPEDFRRGLADDYESFDYEACVAAVENAYNNIKLELDLKKALSGADLVIESMTENFDAKKEMFQKMAPLLDPDTIVVTNSSSMLPSKFTKFTGRPEKYLALHFANTIWKNNTAEVMATKDTSKESFESVVGFARDIRMIPLEIYKEQAGYLLNSQLIPFLFAGMDLYVNGVSDPETIDKAWTLGTGAPKGPFQILDTVGAKTAYEIVSGYTKIPSFLAPYNFKGQAKMLKERIDKGLLGMSSGEGFYKYDKED